MCKCINSRYNQKNKHQILENPKFISVCTIHFKTAIYSTIISHMCSENVINSTLFYHQMGLRDGAGQAQIHTQLLNEEIITSSFSCMSFLFLQPDLYQNTDQPTLHPKWHSQWKLLPQRKIFNIRFWIRYKQQAYIYILFIEA